ncbi:hypothetical protein OPT61_g2809 [Boeremia exigua]|uniref:Uncharacterized protein n=1 Tax=Boeremia exigua TaxID=749465 RepID=A0ACC2IKB6_9PLEO|nr:hypothetical protein OPT61_g2809 [Boeremia exigua]
MLPSLLSSFLIESVLGDVNPTYLEGFDIPVHKAGARGTASSQPGTEAPSGCVSGTHRDNNEGTRGMLEPITRKENIAPLPRPSTWNLPLTRSNELAYPLPTGQVKDPNRRPSCCADYGWHNQPGHINRIGRSVPHINIAHGLALVDSRKRWDPSAQAAGPPRGVETRHGRAQRSSHDDSNLALGAANICRDQALSGKIGFGTAKEAQAIKTRLCWVLDLLTSGVA